MTRSPFFGLVNNDIRGLIDSVNGGSTSAFMWEWFTTKPFVDAGQAKFVRHATPCHLTRRHAPI